jgi:hypothetical protein
VPFSRVGADGRGRVRLQLWRPAGHLHPVRGPPGGAQLAPLGAARPVPRLPPHHGGQRLLFWAPRPRLGDAGGARGPHGLHPRHCRGEARPPPADAAVEKPGVAPGLTRWGCNGEGKVWSAMGGPALCCSASGGGLGRTGCALDAGRVCQHRASLRKLRATVTLRHGPTRSPKQIIQKCECGVPIDTFTAGDPLSTCFWGQ